MHTRNYIIIGTLLGALPLFGAGCGSDLDCGTGTVEVDGECVPTADACGPNATWDDATGKCVGVACADGTTLQDGECVPDGSVICGDGTTYNTTTGECDPDIDGCAEGTTEVDGECVPNDDLLPGLADVQEGAEDNGLTGTPGQFTLPEVGEDVTIYGCVQPFADDDMNGNLDPDYDLYLFNITSPTVVQVKVDGIDGLSGGFEILPLDDELATQDWFRVGVNLVDDISERQVLLPKAGTYGLNISDGRSLLFGEGAGNGDTCYFATITHRAMPTPIAWSTASSKMCFDGTACDDDTDCAGVSDPFGYDDATCDYRYTGQLKDIELFSYDPAEGDIMRPSLGAPSEVAAGALLNLKNGTFQDSGGWAGFGGSSYYWVAGFASSDTVLFAVDYAINYGLSDVDYILDLYAPGAVPLAEDGSTATLTPGRYGNAYGYFDVDDGEVTNFVLNTTVTPPSGFDCAVIPPVGDWYPDCSAAGYDAWYQFVEGGRAYIEVSWTEATATADVDSTITHVMPPAITVDTVVDPTTPLQYNGGYDWYELDVSGEDWLVFDAPVMDNFGDTLDVDFYSRTNSGVLTYGVDYGSLADTTEEFARIVAGDDSLYLVRVSDYGYDGVSDTEDYNLMVAERDFTDLGTVTGNDAPVSVDAASIGADESVFFLVRGAAPLTLDVAVTGTSGFDPVLDELDYDESSLATYDDTGADEVETFSSVVGEDGYIAFMVTGQGGMAGTCDVDAGTLCGDGNLDPGEECDDGDNTSGDGCDATCGVEPFDETEPNSTLEDAEGPYTDQVIKIRGEISPEGDQDWYAITIAAASDIEGETLDGETFLCWDYLMDPYITLYDTDGTTVLYGNDDGGDGYCSLVTAPALPAGTYYMVVDAGDLCFFGVCVFDYTLRITVTPN